MPKLMVTIYKDWERTFLAKVYEELGAPHAEPLEEVKQV
jgi:hypothetical protein